MVNKIDALLVNEKFATKLEKVEIVEDAVALFAKNGVSITAEELNDYLNNLQGDNLTEEDLECVSGGCIVCVGVRLIRGIINSRKRAFGGGGGGR